MRKHKREAQKAQKQKEDEEVKEEDVKVFNKEELVKPVQNKSVTPAGVTTPTTAPIPATPVPTATINPVPPVVTYPSSDYVNLNPYPSAQTVQVRQQQTTTSSDWLAGLLGFLATPAGAELIKWLRENFGKKEDPIAQEAYNQMYDSWKSMYELAKATLANLAMGGTKSYAKGLETYFKELYKIKAGKDAEKIIENKEEEEENPLKILVDTIKALNDKVSKHDEEIAKIKKRVAKKKKAKKEESKAEQTEETQTQEQQSGQPGIFIEETQNNKQGGVFVQ